MNNVVYCCPLSRSSARPRMPWRKQHKYPTKPVRMMLPFTAGTRRMSWRG